MILRAVQAPHSNNKCRIGLKGKCYEGLDLTSGVRHGCPISPLLIVLCVDILLRRLDRLLVTPKVDNSLDIVRTFADDRAMVISVFVRE